MIGEHAGACLRLAIKPDDAARGGRDLTCLNGLLAGADVNAAVDADDAGCHRPVTLATLAGEIRVGDAAQALPGGKQRHGFKDVGFARTIGAKQHDRCWPRFDLSRGVVAEVGDRQSFDVGDHKSSPIKVRLSVSETPQVSSWALCHDCPV
jgi:hypothetical protein